jgi:anti-sigma factor RsiW
MNCREFTEFLHEYLFGDLPAEERAEFDKHLDKCPWCIAYLDRYRKTIQLERIALATSEGQGHPGAAPEELIQSGLSLYLSPFLKPRSPSPCPTVLSPPFWQGC